MTIDEAKKKLAEITPAEDAAYKDWVARQAEVTPAYDKWSKLAGERSALESFIRISEAAV